jgi:DNA-binding protein HU-beta
LAGFGRIALLGAQAASHEQGFPGMSDKPEKKDSFFKRQDLAGAVVEKTGLPRAKAVAAVDAVLEIIGEHLKLGQEVRLVGFGAFMVSKRKAGKGRDPRTGSEINIPEGKSVRFRPGKALRDAVSGKVAAVESED